MVYVEAQEEVAEYTITIYKHHDTAGYASLSNKIHPSIPEIDLVCSATSVTIIYHVQYNYEMPAIRMHIL